MPNLVLQHKNSSTVISIQNADIDKKDVENEIIAILIRHGSICNNMAVINEELKQWNANFSAKKFGYSKFSSFLQSFDTSSFEIDADQNSVKLKDNFTNS